jgi:hypothetical protein
MVTGMSGDSVDAQEMGADGHAPARLDTLPDDRRSVMLGDVPGYAAFNHQQGDNPEHFRPWSGQL